MVFSSQIFLFYFLPLVLALYYVLPFRARTALIAVSSYVVLRLGQPDLGRDHVLRLERRLRVRARAAAAVGAARRRRPAAGDRPRRAAHRAR